MLTICPSTHNQEEEEAGIWIQVDGIPEATFLTTRRASDMTNSKLWTVQQIFWWVGF